MTSTIIAVAASYYLFAYGISLLPGINGIGTPVVLAALPTLLAGILGGLQFTRTERRGMRLSTRLICSLKSCAAIVLAPIVFGFAISAVSLLFAGLGTATLIPELAAMMTLTALMALLVFVIIGAPAIFIGLTVGQRLYYHVVMR